MYSDPKTHEAISKLMTEKVLVVLIKIDKKMLIYYSQNVFKILSNVIKKKEKKS